MGYRIEWTVGCATPGEGDGGAFGAARSNEAPESVASRATRHRVTGPASRIKDSFSPRTRRARPPAYLLPRSRVKAHRTSAATLRRLLGSLPPGGGRVDGEPVTRPWG